MRKQTLKQTSVALLTSALVLTQPLHIFAQEVVIGTNTGITLTEGSAQTGTSTKAELDDYLYGLEYDKDLVLTRNGQTIENVFPKTGQREKDRFIVIEKVKKTLQDENPDVSVLASNENRVFAGALLRADSNLLENNPTLISARRAPLTLSIDLPGLTDGKNAVQVSNPSNSTVKGAVNDLIDRWHRSGNGYTAVPAAMQYTEAMVKDAYQVKVQFGLDLEKAGAPFSVNFDAIHRGEKQTCIVKLNQVYYNVSVDAPHNPSDFFADGVTAKDLIRYGINNQTPPVYVSNVAYGRTMYIKLETSSNSTNVHAAFKALIKGVEIAPDTEFQKILDSTNVTAVVMGGNAAASAKIVNGTVGDLKAIIQEGANYNKDNPAVPVSYRTTFVKHNVPAVVKNNSEYIETKVTSYKDGELVLKHTGGYVAKFFVDWEEVSYVDGVEHREPKSWEFNGASRTSGFEAHIPLKGNVRNLNVKAIEATGLVWEPWRTVYEKTDLELAQQREIWIWGTTLNPKHHDIVTNN